MSLDDEPGDAKLMHTATATATTAANATPATPRPATFNTGLTNTDSSQQNNVRSKKLFPQKLWDLINDVKYNFCLRWSEDGQLVYLNRDEFEEYYLKTNENQFHTQKAISFVRQMNMYGFRKVDDFYYENDNFRRDNEHLLKNMIRKHPNKSNSLIKGHDLNCDKNDETVQNFLYGSSKVSTQPTTTPLLPKTGAPVSLLAPIQQRANKNVTHNNSSSTTPTTTSSLNDHRRSQVASSPFDSFLISSANEELDQVNVGTCNANLLQASTSLPRNDQELLQALLLQHQYPPQIPLANTQNPNTQLSNGDNNSLSIPTDNSNFNAFCALLFTLNQNLYQPASRPPLPTINTQNLSFDSFVDNLQRFYEKILMRQQSSQTDLLPDDLN